MSNRLKEKIRAGNTIYGTHVSLGDMAVCDILGRIGFDYLWIDTEHTSITMDQVLAHITVTQARAAAAVVRVPPDDYVTLKRVLEMGPDGIIFPMVQGAEHAKQLVDYTLYPPLGTRGFGPRAAVAYGLADTNEYVTKGSQEMCRFVQIETRGAYEELDGILANPWVDGVIVGPCDLAGQFGSLTDVMAPHMLDIIRDIAHRARAAGKAAGLSIGANDLESLKTWFSLGINMLSTGGDTHALIESGRKTLSTLHAAWEAGGVPEAGI